MLLNIDAGERDDESEELWLLADILSIACGGHAGTPQSMKRLAEFCAANNKGVGAHPSYFDRDNFGRVSVTMPPESLALEVRRQCSDLAAASPVRVGWVKPHGALYHDANARREIAEAVVDGAQSALETFVLIGPPSGQLADLARERNITFLREGFADRTVNAEGNLVPRSEPNALITDPTEAAARARELVGKVDTVCVHGDTEGAVAIARAVREAIRNA
jgi:5-oxoprolinase (ATP-hydrolysing) subunit A